jgi:hypothetical protein
LRRRAAPINPAPTISADVPQTRMAIASWVKLLAVPGPPPGPWDAKAGLADSKAAIAGAAAKASADIGSLVRFDAMIISCKERLSEDTGESLCRFCKLSH